MPKRCRRAPARRVSAMCIGRPGRQPCGSSSCRGAWPASWRCPVDARALKAAGAGRGPIDRTSMPACPAARAPRREPDWPPASRPKPRIGIEMQPGALFQLEPARLVRSTTRRAVSGTSTSRAPSIRVANFARLMAHHEGVGDQRVPEGSRPRTFTRPGGSDGRAGWIRSASITDGGRRREETPCRG